MLCLLKSAKALGTNIIFLLVKAFDPSTIFKADLLTFRLMNFILCSQIVDSGLSGEKRVVRGRNFFIIVLIKIFWEPVVAVVLGADVTEVNFENGIVFDAF